MWCFPKIWDWEKFGVLDSGPLMGSGRSETSPKTIQMLKKLLIFVTPIKYIPLTNRSRGPYCKLRTEFFPIDLWEI